MTKRIGFLTTGSNQDSYMYLETASGESLAFGADIATNTFNINTSPTSGAIPKEATSNFAIDASSNGDIAFLPNGTGSSVFANGDVEISSGDLDLTTALGGAAKIFSTGEQVLSVQTLLNNTFVGPNAGGSVLASSNNTGIGDNSLSVVEVGAVRNTAVGANSGISIENGSDNAILGYNSGLDLVDSNKNTLLGSSVLRNSVSAERNLCVGYFSGNNYGAAESNNILLSNVGQASENNTIRIGTQGGGAGQQNRCFLAGVSGVTPLLPSQVVVVDSLGQLGSIVAPVASEFADNLFRIFDDLDTTKKIAFQASSITTGTTRTITMADRDLSLSTPTFDETTLTQNLNLPATNAALTTGVITIDSVRFLHGKSGNVYIGPSAGNGNASNENIAIGNTAMTAVNATGVQNVAIGSRALTALTTGDSNVAVGYESLDVVTTGSGNHGFGYQTLGSIGTSASFNLAIGHAAGLSLTTTDSNNVIINHRGTAGDNNTIRIGTQGSGNEQQDTAFIAGIYNVAPGGGNDGMVIIDSLGQLGSQTDLLMPNNPAFLVLRDADVSNVTGDGTVYTVVWDSEIFDQDSNMTTTTFTAPVTGRYQLAAAIQSIDASAAYIFALLQIVTSNRTYQNNNIAELTTRSHVISVTADMDASDTATVTLRYGNLTKIVDIQGNTGAGATVTYFSGCLIS